MHRLVLLLLITPMISACSFTGVKPWDRELLAQKQMQLDPYPIDTFIDEHIYFSKENSSGGSGIGGGGCGCN